MNSRLIQSTDGCRRAILLFSGWATSPEMFAGLSLPGYDLIIVWDYTDTQPFVQDLEKYNEICIVAWSYGVFMADYFMSTNPELPVTARIAVNGTPWPVDDSRGIPEALFTSTLESIDEAALTKFQRRMTGGAAAYNSFLAACTVRRTAESARAELEAIRCLSRERSPSAAWDQAWISARDLVISPANQMNAWSGKTDIVTADWPHLPDFGEILRRSIIVKEKVADSFDKAYDTYASNAKVQAEVAGHLFSLVSGKIPAGSSILELGGGTGFLTALITDRFGSDALTVVDIGRPPATAARVITDDAELWIRGCTPGSYSAILASSTIQWFNSPASFLASAFKALAPGGCVGISVYGAETFHEIEGLASPSRLFTRESLLRSVPAGASGVRVEEQEITLSFDNPMELLRHFRLTGVKGSGSPGSTALARGIVKAGVTRLTYCPLYLTFTRPGG